MRQGSLIICELVIDQIILFRLGRPAQQTKITDCGFPGSQPWSHCVGGPYPWRGHGIVNLLSCIFGRVGLRIHTFLSSCLMSSGCCRVPACLHWTRAPFLPPTRYLDYAPAIGSTRPVWRGAYRLSPGMIPCPQLLISVSRVATK